MTASTTAKYADLDLEFVEFRGEEDAEATIQEQGFSADLARFDFFERMSQAVGLRGALKHCGLDVSHDEAESVWDDVKKEIGAAYQRGAARVVAAYGAVE